MPIDAEKPFPGRITLPDRTTDNCLMKRENLTTTKPKPIKAILVRIQAKKVRSFAK